MTQKSQQPSQQPSQNLTPTPLAELPPEERSLCDLHLWQFSFCRDIFWIGLILAILAFCFYLRDILLPVFVGLGLAYVFNPLITYIEKRWNVPRLVTISALLLVLFGGSLIGLAYVGPLFVNQAAALSQDFPKYQEQLQNMLEEQRPWGPMIAQLQQRVTESPEILVRGFGGRFSSGFGWFTELLGGISYLFFCLFLIPFFFFYYAWQFQPTVDRWKRIIPDSQRKSTLIILRKMDAAVGDFIRGRIICTIFLCIFFSAGWAMVGVPYSALLGTITGILGAIPWAAGLGWPVAIMLKYLDLQQGGSGDESVLMAAVVWPSVVYFAVQIIENNLLTPWVQSESMDMNPATVFIVILIGGAMAGFFGLLLALPVAACLKIFFNDVLYPRLVSWAEEP